MVVDEVVVEVVVALGHWARASCCSNAALPEALICWSWASAIACSCGGVFLRMSRVRASIMVLNACCLLRISAQSGGLVVVVDVGMIDVVDVGMVDVGLVGREHPARRRARLNSALR